MTNPFGKIEEASAFRKIDEAGPFRKIGARLISNGKRERLKNVCSSMREDLSCVNLNMMLIISFRDNKHKQDFRNHFSQLP